MSFWRNGRDLQASHSIRIRPYFLHTRYHFGLRLNGSDHGDNNVIRKRGAVAPHPPRDVLDSLGSTASVKCGVASLIIAGPHFSIAAQSQTIVRAQLILLSSLTVQHAPTLTQP